MGYFIKMLRVFIAPFHKKTEHCAAGVADYECCSSAPCRSVIVVAVTRKFLILFSTSSIAAVSFTRMSAHFSSVYSSSCGTFLKWVCFAIPHLSTITCTVSFCLPFRRMSVAALAISSFTLCILTKMNP